MHPEGELDPEEVDKLVKPYTKMVVINHASNVVGTLPARTRNRGFAGGTAFYSWWIPPRPPGLIL